ncbi:hypothetical protein C8J57DRAFT_1238418 [Mycena rebaudengoi]|nr:hypothetical protein C8J57DRAFT_1238418 [Mycena rebaudengoi]
MSCTVQEIGLVYTANRFTSEIPQEGSPVEDWRDQLFSTGQEDGGFPLSAFGHFRSANKGQKMTQNWFEPRQKDNCVRAQGEAANIPRQFLPPKINQQHKEISIQADFVLDILLGLHFEETRLKARATILMTGVTTTAVLRTVSIPQSGLDGLAIVAEGAFSPVPLLAHRQFGSAGPQADLTRNTRSSPIVSEEACSLPGGSAAPTGFRKNLEKQKYSNTLK